MRHMCGRPNFTKIVKNIITDKNSMVKLRYSEKGTKFEKKSPTYLFWRLFTQ